MSRERIVYKTASSPWNFICAVITATIGHAIHGSIFWTIIDFFFWPIAWIKWIICQEVSLSIIKKAFSFFLT